MRITFRLLAFALIFCLAVPAAALAQSAGDEQYSDPFQEDQPADQGNQGDQGNQNSGDQANQNSGTQAQDPQPAETAPAQSSQPTDTTATGAQTLPRTGLPALWLALSGAALLGAGIGLRRTA
jgi:hypothetical protein